MISNINWKAAINDAIKTGKFPNSVTNYSCRWQTCAIPEIFGANLIGPLNHFQAFTFIRNYYGEKVIELGRDFNTAVLMNHPKEAHRIYKELEAMKIRMNIMKMVEDKK